jgi:catechol 2,3-dioxygenase-like lactoylglutathione lyase family enzyme
MTVKKLEHYTIRCSDLDRTRDFYCDVLGLTVGDRPPLGFKGYWLYIGETPVVHLVDRAEAEAMAGGPRPSKETGPLDHVAFLSSDIQATRSVLRARDLKFREVSFPGFMDQIFVPDPDNILVELTFRHGSKD